MKKTSRNLVKFLKNTRNKLLRTITLFIADIKANVNRYFRKIDGDMYSPKPVPTLKLPSLAGPVHNLGGGGPDVEDAIQWMIHQVRGGKDSAHTINVAVIRANGSDDYNRLIYNMRGVKYVETLIISSKQEANREDVFEKIKNADVIFFAGGDQCQYIRNWKNTNLELAVKSVYARGGGIGGTSAGAMIQSDYIFDACACEDSPETKEALEDPYRNITFTYNFFPWNSLRATIIDTHFDRRKRMGRIMTFIARQIQDGAAKNVLGIAISEETSVVIDKYGIAKVMGRGAAYFILGDHKPEVCQPQTPLTFQDYKIWRLRSGDSFDLNDRQKKGYYLRSVIKGRFSSDPY